MKGYTNRKKIYTPCDDCGLLVDRVNVQPRTVCYNCKNKVDKLASLKRKSKV